MHVNTILQSSLLVVLPGIADHVDFPVFRRSIDPETIVRPRDIKSTIFSHDARDSIFLLFLFFF